MESASRSASEANSLAAGASTASYVYPISYFDLMNLPSSVVAPSSSCWMPRWNFEVAIMGISTSLGRGSSFGGGGVRPPSRTPRKNFWRQVSLSAPDTGARTGVRCMRLPGNQWTPVKAKHWKSAHSKCQVRRGKNRIAAPVTGVSHSRIWSNQKTHPSNLNAIAPETGVVVVENQLQLLQKLESFLDLPRGFVQQTAKRRSPAFVSRFPHQSAPFVTVPAGHVGGCSESGDRSDTGLGTQNRFAGHADPVVGDRPQWPNSDPGADISARPMTPSGYRLSLQSHYFFLGREIKWRV